jgi:DNA-binding transcriptional ArsR family regulator
VAPSTLTHHFRVLREAGVIRQREAGSKRWSALRTDDLQARFPGILETIMAVCERDSPGKASPGGHRESAA